LHCKSRQNVFCHHIYGKGCISNLFVIEARKNRKEVLIRLAE
jgi:hypothetical protein